VIGLNEPVFTGYANASRLSDFSKFGIISLLEVVFKISA